MFHDHEISYISFVSTFKDDNKSFPSEADHLVSLPFFQLKRGSRVFAVQSISGVDTIPEPTQSGSVYSLKFVIQVGIPSPVFPFPPFLAWKV